MDSETYCCLTCNVKFFQDLREFLEIESVALLDDAASVVDDDFIVDDDDEKDLIIYKKKKNIVIDEENCVSCNVTDLVAEICEEGMCMFEDDCRHCVCCGGKNLIRGRTEEDEIHGTVECLDCGHERDWVHLKNLSRMCAMCQSFYQ